MNLLKFTSNKNILSEVVALGYNQVCSQILSFNKLYVFFLLKLNASRVWSLTKINSRIFI